MARIITVGAAQLGPIARSETRAQVVGRMLTLLAQAKSHGCDLAVFPELALTTFFPRWYLDRQDDIDAYFEREMPGPETQKLFDAASRLGIAFYLGYAELTPEGRHFNTSILVDKQGNIVSKYRKIVSARRTRLDGCGCDQCVVDGCQRCGSSSAMRRAGWVGKRSSTSCR